MLNYVKHWGSAEEYFYESLEVLFEKEKINITASENSIFLIFG